MPPEQSTERRFPILGQSESVPWSIVEPHREAAMGNHHQTLERLAERGGLSWCELAAVLGDRRWRPLPEAEAKRLVLEGCARAKAAD